jgi:prepilin-type processing-associated H-X9-DG protein
VGSTNWQERIAPYLVGNKGTVNNQRFVLRTYLGCPSDKGNGVVYGINKYLTPEYRSGAFTRIINLKTKASDTLLVGENYTADLWNYNAGNGKSSDNVDYTRHKVGGKKAVANFLFADFHVETLSFQAATDRPVKMVPDL